jgi:hypothetical protein
MDGACTLLLECACCRLCGPLPPGQAEKGGRPPPPLSMCKKKERKKNRQRSRQEASSMQHIRMNAHAAVLVHSQPRRQPPRAQAQGAGRCGVQRCGTQRLNVAQSKEGCSAQVPASLGGCSRCQASLGNHSHSRPQHDRHSWPHVHPTCTSVTRSSPQSPHFRQGSPGAQDASIWQITTARGPRQKCAGNPDGSGPVGRGAVHSAAPSRLLLRVAARRPAFFCRCGRRAARPQNMHKCRTAPRSPALPDSPRMKQIASIC